MKLNGVSNECNLNEIIFHKHFSWDSPLEMVTMATISLRCCFVVVVLSFVALQTIRFLREYLEDVYIAWMFQATGIIVHPLQIVCHINLQILFN